MLVSGDQADVARDVAESVGTTRCTPISPPEQKLAVVEDVRAESAGSVVMVGDGINDAPALALADVGHRDGSARARPSPRRRRTSSSSSNGPIASPLTIRVGQRSLHIARQSVVAGLGLSIGAMFVAAFGYLPPVWGALFQEVIDVAVILNALRALHG